MPTERVAGMPMVRLCQVCSEHDEVPMDDFSGPLPGVPVFSIVYSVPKPQRDKRQDRLIDTQTAGYRRIAPDSALLMTIS